MFAGVRDKSQCEASGGLYMSAEGSAGCASRRRCAGGWRPAVWQVSLSRTGQCFSSLVALLGAEHACLQVGGRKALGDLVGGVI